jgi:hypothetical protein
MALHKRTIVQRLGQRPLQINATLRAQALKGQFAMAEDQRAAGCAELPTDLAMAAVKPKKGEVPSRITHDMLPYTLSIYAPLCIQRLRKKTSPGRIGEAHAAGVRRRRDTLDIAQE